MSIAAAPNTDPRAAGPDMADPKPRSTLALSHSTRDSSAEVQLTTHVEDGNMAAPVMAHICCLFQALAELFRRWVA